MKNYIKEILYILGTSKNRIFSLLYLFLTLSIFDLLGMGLVTPFISILTSDDFSSGRFSFYFEFLDVQNKHEALFTSGVILLITFSIRTALSLWVNYKIISFSQNEQVRLRSILMRKYQFLPYINYLSRNSSEYIDTTHRLVAQFAETMILNLLRSVSDILVAILILSLLLYVNPVAFILMVIIFGSSVILYDFFFKKKVKLYGREANNSAIATIKSLHEGINGMKNIRILGREEFFHTRLVNASENFSKNKKYFIIFSTTPRYLFELTFIVFFVLLVFGSTLNQKDPLYLLPTLGLFAIAAMRLLPIFYTVSNTLVHLRNGRDTVSRLSADLKDLEGVQLIKKYGVTPSKEAFNSLRIQNISFQYPSGKRQALRDVSMEIKHGETIGIIGPSGSGKTTLVDVLLGLLTPQSGNVYFNEDNIKLNMSGIRSHVAYLPQDVFLINDTLIKNITLSNKDLSTAKEREKILKALGQAQLNEVLKSLPNGIDTVIGERGINLSGGQRQRVALARAFYHNRDILVMDEATSALDSKTEQEVIAEIKRLKGKKTIIMIAHRLSTVQDCDRIYKLEAGKINKSGCPTDVISAL